MPPPIIELPWPPRVAAILADLIADTERLDDLTSGQLDTLRVIARDLPVEAAVPKLEAIETACRAAQDWQGAITAVSAIAHLCGLYPDAAGAEA